MSVSRQCHVAIGSSLKVNLNRSLQAGWPEPPPTVLAGNLGATGATRSELRLTNDSPEQIEGSFTYTAFLPLIGRIDWTCAVRCPTTGGGQISVVTTSPKPAFIVVVVLLDGDNVSVTISYRDTIRTSLLVRRIQIIHPVTRIIPKRSHGIVAANNEDIWTTTIEESVKDETTTVHGSFKPVSTSLTSAQVALRLTVSPDADLLGVPLRLRGSLNGRDVVLQDITFTTGMNWIFGVNFRSKYTGTPWGDAGDIQWILCIANSLEPGQEPRSGPTLLNNTRVEIYGISHEMPDGYKNPGIPVDLLRLMVIPAPGPTPDLAEGYLKFVVERIFNDFSFKYDAYEGGPTFVTNGDELRSEGGNFDLGWWLELAIEQTPMWVNCFDQAGIAQICVSLKLGSPPEPWAFLTPFGCIKETAIVGWGNCNNPWFRNEKFPPLKVVPPGTNRSYFGSHTFLMLEGLGPVDAYAEMEGTRYPGIVDCCCGPFTGEENINYYISRSIDLTQTQSQGKRFAMASYIRRFAGIVSLGAAPRKRALPVIIRPSIPSSSSSQGTTVTPSSTTSISPTTSPSTTTSTIGSGGVGPSGLTATTGEEPSSSTTPPGLPPSTGPTTLSVTGGQQGRQQPSTTTASAFHDPTIISLMTLAYDPTSDPPQASSADFSSFDNIIDPSGHSQLLHHSVSLAPFAAQHRWIYRNSKGSSVSIRMAYAQNHAQAQDIMADHLSMVQALLGLDEKDSVTGGGVFVKPPKGDAKGQFNLETAQKGRASLWVRGNLFWDVESLDGLSSDGADGARPAGTAPGDFDLAAVTKRIDAFVARAAVDPAKAALPLVRSLAASKPGPVVGETFTVTATVNSPLAGMTASSTKGNVALISQDLSTTSFAFLALRPGAGEIVCSFCHRQTLAVASLGLALSVLAA